MPRFVTHVAVMLVLILGAQPVAAAACQWVCAPIATEANSGLASHHHHSTAPAPPDSSDAPSVRDAGRSCDHQDAAAVALRTTHFKLSAPSAVDAASLDPLDASRDVHVASSDPAHSPPGTRSAPTPLRI